MDTHNQNPNQNPNWGFTINLSGIRPATGAASVLPEGYYKAVIADAYTLTDKPGRVVFKLNLTGGEFDGMVRTTGLGVPKTDQDGVRHYWRALLESAGYTPAQIDAGAVGMQRDLLVGRTVTIHYVPGDKDAGIYEELNFLPPAEWDKKAAAFAQREKSPAASTSASPGRTAGLNGGAATGAALGAALGTPAPAVTVSPPTNGLGGVGAGDLMAALGRR